MVMNYENKKLIHLVLFQPEIPQNTGSIIRLCSCFSIPIEIIEPCGFILDDKRLKRVAMDYGNQTQIIRHKSWECFIENKALSKRRLVLFTTKTKNNYQDFTFLNDDLLIFGNESSGVTDNVRENIDEAITIPISQHARSLNVSMSAAIGLSEALRQTKK